MSRRESSCIIAYIELNFNLHSYTPTVVCSVFLEMLEWSWENFLLLISAVFGTSTIIMSIKGMYLHSFLSKLYNQFRQNKRDAIEFNRVQIVIIENHMEKPVYITWGSINEKTVEFRGLIPIAPRTSISRKIRSLDYIFSTSRCSVQIWKDGNQMGENVVCHLFDPGEVNLTKVFIVKDTEVTEQRNPTVRNWILGDLDMYQD